MAKLSDSSLLCCCAFFSILIFPVAAQLASPTKLPTQSLKTSKSSLRQLTKNVTEKHLVNRESEFVHTRDVNDIEQKLTASSNELTLLMLVNDGCPSCAAMKMLISQFASRMAIFPRIHFFSFSCGSSSASVRFCVDTCKCTVTPTIIIFYPKDDPMTPKDGKKLLTVNVVGRSGVKYNPMNMAYEDIRVALLSRLIRTYPEGMDGVSVNTMRELLGLIDGPTKTKSRSKPQHLPTPHIDECRNSQESLILERSLHQEVKTAVTRVDEHIFWITDVDLIATASQRLDGISDDGYGETPRNTLNRRSQGRHEMAQRAIVHLVNVTMLRAESVGVYADGEDIRVLKDSIAALKMILEVALELMPVKSQTAIPMLRLGNKVGDAVNEQLTEVLTALNLISPSLSSPTVTEITPEMKESTRSFITASKALLALSWDAPLDLSDDERREMRQWGQFVCDSQQCFLWMLYHTLTSLTLQRLCVHTISMPDQPRLQTTKVDVSKEIENALTYYSNHTQTNTTKLCSKFQKFLPPGFPRKLFESIVQATVTFLPCSYCIKHIQRAVEEDPYSLATITSASPSDSSTSAASQAVAVALFIWRLQNIITIHAKTKLTLDYFLAQQSQEKLSAESSSSPSNNYLGTDPSWPTSEMCYSCRRNPQPNPEKYPFSPNVILPSHVLKASCDILRDADVDFTANFDIMQLIRFLVFAYAS